MIPVAVVGTDVVAPPGKKFGTWTRPLVRFGKPLDFSRYEGLENDRFMLRSVTDEIMYEIMRLSEQEYVDLYASKAKELSAKAKEEAKRAEKEAAKAAGTDASSDEPAESPAAGADDARQPAGLLTVAAVSRGRNRRRSPSRTASSAPSRCCA